MKKILKILSFTLIFLTTLLLGVFVTLSIYFRQENFTLAILGTLLFLASYIIFLASLKVGRFRLGAFGVYLLTLSIWSYWYSTIKPSNDRQWQKDVAVLAYATIDKNLVTVHNIRNFKYKSEFDYNASYYDETFDINRLQSLNFIATYWMGPDVAHTFLSFNFSDDKHLAISIEARKEMDESYSMIRGFFKDNELYYVVADERDLIGLRTNIRKNPPEHVYMYEINASPQEERKVFLNYMQRLNELKENPEFYNTLTTNCTTSIWKNSLVSYSNMKFNWEILVSGHTARYLYKHGLLKTYGLSFEELQKRSYINPLVQDAPIDDSFSKKIRSVDFKHLQ